MLYSLLQKIVSFCSQILAKLVLMRLDNIRRFDRLEQIAYDNQVTTGNRMARIEALLDSIDHQVEDGFARILAAVEPLPVASVVFTVIFEGNITEGATHMQLKDNQQFDFTLSGKDAKGAAANIDGSKTTATIDDTAVATVTLNPDGLGGTVVAQLTGKTQLKVTVTDAVNTGDTQTGALDLEILAGDLATIQIGTAAPVDQPPPPNTGAAQAR